MEKEQRKVFDDMDTINGAMGRCIAKINGREEDLNYLVSINTKIDTISNFHKMTGEMRLYYGSASILTNIYVADTNTKKHTYFDLVVINDDTKSNIGKQEIVLKDVYITCMEIAKLDANSTELTQNIKFAFKSAEIISTFKKRISKRADGGEIDKNDLERLRRFADESALKAKRNKEISKVNKIIDEITKKVQEELKN